jgi:ribosomal protein S12 methylthiotransferase accessory factor
VPLTHSLHVPEDLRVLADPRGGIVRRLFIFDNDGLDTPTVPSCCRVDIGPFSDERISIPATSGEGKGATRDEAVRSAVGEGLERYAASLWHPSTLIYASPRELGDRAFDPRWLVLYSEAQYARKHFAYASFDSKRPIYWTAGQWLDSNEPVSIPALATYLNFPADPAERFCQTTSSGLAAGDSFEDAALRALYELIERDAFMLFWLSRRSGLRIDLRGCDELTHKALSEVERLGARTEVFLLDSGTQHPTVVCLGLGDGRSWPGATIGLGTHANPDVALYKAVFEHNHYGTYMRRLMREGRHRGIRKSSDVLGSLDHGLYYVYPDHVRGLRFFRGSSRPSVSLDDMRSQYRKEAKLSACVSALLDIGIRTAAVDVTSSDVALAGIRVVRGFGVNMQPIHFGSGYERLKSPRLEALLSNKPETRPHPIA